MKKHVPKKDKNTNILRCILLNINENKSTLFFDYKFLTESRYKALVNALLENGIIKPIDNIPENYDTIGFIIADKIKYESWLKSDFYKAIDNYVIPLIKFSTELMEHIPL